MKPKSLRYRTALSVAVAVLLVLTPAIGNTGEKKDDQQDNLVSTSNTKLSPKLNRLLFSHKKGGDDEAKHFISENKLRTQDDLIEFILVISAVDPLQELSRNN